MSPKVADFSDNIMRQIEETRVRSDPTRMDRTLVSTGAVIVRREADRDRRR
jgi:hypothetical protein